MGICASSRRVQQEEDSDENVVYVMDEQGGGGGADGDGHGRKVASLFSQKGKKGPNQDAVILCQGFGMEDGVFCGVFDGHGRCGQFISKLVRDYLPFMILSHRNALLLGGSDDDDDDPVFSDASPAASSTDGSGRSSPNALAPAQLLEEWREACANAFQAMDKELKLQANVDCNFSGTTAVCAIKQGKDLIIANLGDSRAVLATMSETGYLKAVQLTTDQKPNVPQEAERIKRSNGRVFALKDEPSVLRVWLPDEDCPGLAMARSLGDYRLKRHGVVSEPEVTHRRVASGDLFIILATDGVWDVLSNEEVVSIVCATPRKQHASKAVAEAAAQRWRTRYPASRVDDCSAVCLFLRDQQDWASSVAAAKAKGGRRETAARPLAASAS
ncbi:unnamed protein product [Miscanthus lutarioriparius]|uniref:protein-serine/threonine phosphatase n=1 Tax=Miscanthus lutarioriparius TaxID=422564 RepID=A0A811PXV9_9POAL|nr:unnamed protein product [Miscanthus lutarioriparius]